MLQQGKTQASYQFTNKAATLAQLRGQLQQGEVQPVFTLTYRDYQSVTSDLCQQVWASCEKPLVVRSAHSNEDGLLGTMAGKYASILHITEFDSFTDAIETVFNSYGDTLGLDEIVLIQPQVTEVTHCGVCFTRDPDTGSPYYLISNDTSGQTDSITSGKMCEFTTHVLYREQPPSDVLTNRIVHLAKELEYLFDTDAIDIEYAIDSSDRLWLLQVRPLFLKSGRTVLPKALLAQVAEKLHSNARRHPYLFGDQTLYGVMPDWNPAEIIGICPKPLALSLYKELVTNSTWAYQRNNYGYMNLRSFPLMVDFLGLPYIDVRVSFNSFLPKGMDKHLADKLVNYYLQCLRDNPQQHDKVEFDIVLSCFTPALSSKLEQLKQAGFTDLECQDIVGLLRGLTNKIIDPRSGLWIQDLHRIEELKSRIDTINLSATYPISRIYWLLEDCKRYGTLPFAGLARAGFIAVQLLQSLVQTGCFSDEDYHRFMVSLNTVSSKISQDINRLDKSSFLQEYGHLRPGTYDICSPRYDQQPDLYFKFGQQDSYLGNKPLFTLSAEQYQKIKSVLASSGINHCPDSLLHFIRSAIEGREYAKFVFTRSLSDTLESIAALGAEYGISREELSFLDIATIYRLYVGAENVEDCLRADIARGKERYAMASLVKLPPLLTQTNDVYEFTLGNDEPNYITHHRVSGEVAVYPDLDDIEDKIVLIANADPGFDWLFSHRIKGFITAFGGCNSHMAIRAAELGIPAAIGAGQVKYNQWAAANVLEIDCGSRTVRSVC